MAPTGEHTQATLASLREHRALRVEIATFRLFARRHKRQYPQSFHSDLGDASKHKFFACNTYGNMRVYGPVPKSLHSSNILGFIACDSSTCYFSGRQSW